MELLQQLKKDFPAISFKTGSKHFWSPHDKRITYILEDQESPEAIWALLHEVGHAVLEHDKYESDFELLRLEVAAWQNASELAGRYGLEIDEEHVQDCLDTYRDWLHRRSTCPGCGNHSLQKDPKTYECFNCHTVWKVSVSRFCRPYRRLQKTSF